jgi:hypothetical protein
MRVTFVIYFLPVLLHIIKQNMSIKPIITRSDNTTSMSITEALALSPTNRLTPAERKALSKSDQKAGKLLGITLTRNDVGHANHSRKLALVPSANQENVQSTPGDMMALLGAKRARGRNGSTVTMIGKLHDLGLGAALGMGIEFVERRSKKRRVGAHYTQRVILGHLCSNDEALNKEELSTAGSDDGAYSFLELDDDEDAKTSLAGEFLQENDAEDEDEILFGSPPGSGFAWDVEDPFNTPLNPVLQQYFEAMRLNEGVGPLDDPVAHSDRTPNFDKLYEDEDYSTFSCNDSFDDLLRPSENAYLDFLIAQDEAEEEPFRRRRERRAVLRSRNKMLDVLGEEARQIVDGQY